MKCYFGITLIALVMLQAAQSAPFGKPGKPVKVARPGKKRDGVCVSGQDRHQVIQAAENAQSNGNYERMAKCMKRAVTLDSKLTTKERRMFEEAYELWATQLYKTWKNAKSIKLQRKAKANLQLVVDDVMDMLEGTLIPSVDEDIVNMHIDLIGAKQDRIEITKYLQDTKKVEVFLDDSIYLGMKVKYYNLDLMLSMGESSTPGSTSLPIINE